MKVRLVLHLVFLLTPLSLISQQWEQFAKPLWGGRPQEIHRDVSGNLWASAGTAVFRSTDQGATWVDRSPAAQLSFMKSMGYRLATLVWPGATPLIIVYPSNGTSSTIYVSLSAGTSWEEVPMPEQFVGQPLYIKGLSNGTSIAFVGIGSSTVVMVSTNSGSTWTMESTLGSRPDLALEANNGTLYCIEPEARVIRMRSTLGEWSTVPPPTSGDVGNLALSRDQLLVTVDSDSSFVTTDNGVTWRAHGLRFPGMESNVNNISGLQDGSFIGSSQMQLPGNLTQFSCWRLEEGASEWTLKADSLSHELDDPIALDGSSFIVIDDRGPMVSTDGGATFNVRAQGIPMHFIWRHAISNTTAIACTISGDVFRINIDDGDWENVTQYPRSRGDFPAFDVVHAGNDAFLLNTRSGVQRSSDAGRTWQPVDLPSTVAYHEFAVGAANAVYIASSSNIFRTTDGGVTWDTVFSVPTDASYVVADVAIGANGRVFFSTGKAVYAIDGGTATLLRAVSTSIGLLRTSPWNPQLLAYIMADEDAASRTISASTDGGVNWRDVEFIATPGVEPPAFDAVMLPTGTYIASSFDGLTFVNAPDAEMAATEPVVGIGIPMSLSLDGGFYYRGRNSYIEYRPYPTSVNESGSDGSGTFVAHPTPARSSVTITGTTLGTPLVVSDARGSVVTELTAGEGQTTVNVEGLAPGVYVVRSGTSSVPIVVY